MWSKKIRAVSLALVGVFVMTVSAACGSDGDKGDKDFVIGGFGALTGPVAGWGEAQRNGAELAIKDVNASGDLDYNLVLKYEDDACSPAGAQSVYHRLVGREDVDMLFGSACSASALAVADLAEADGVVYLSPTATTVDMVEPPREHVFSTQVNSATEAQELVRLALEQYNPTKVAFMYNSNEYGLAAIEGAKAALKEQAPDVEIVADAGFPEGTSQFDSGLIKLRDAQPDVVFVVGVGSDLGPMIRSARQLGVTAEIVGFSSLFTSETIRTAGDLLENVTGFFYSPVRVASDSENPEVADLAQRYMDEYGEWPDGIALQGYEGIMTIAAALKNLDDKEPTSENLIKAFEEIKDLDLGTRMPISFGPDDRQGPESGVLMKLLPGREETTSLWGNFEIVSAG